MTKDSNWEFGIEQQEAFTKIKTLLSSYPILQLPNFNKEFIIDCDASGVGISAILTQVDNNGKEYVVEYG